jgi:lantibiotic modifying enzyme
LSRESTSSAGLDAPINAMVRATALVDHLCCGNAGRAEVLFEAGRVLGRPDYISVAFTILSSVVRTAKMRGDYSLGMPEIRLQPWLFQGHAGIAWALAHIAAPDRLPSILTFQLPTNEPG